jgi:acetyl esterase/lipase
LKGRVRGILGFGTYHSLADTVRFGLTGQFEWRERTEYLRPDPYGRWVVASNYLHRIPGYEEAEDVSRALGELATLAGRHGIMSWDPSSDPFKERVLAAVSPGNRGLFRLFAPVAAREPDPVLARELFPLLAEAGRATHPGLEVPESLPTGVLPPVRLIHGRHDHLIPFTETLALERFLRKRADVTATVTDLFAHSKGSGRRVVRPGEAVRFLSAIRGALRLDTR